MWTYILICAFEYVLNNRFSAILFERILFIKVIWRSDSLLLKIYVQCTLTSLLFIMRLMAYLAITKLKGFVYITAILKLIKCWLLFKRRYGMYAKKLKFLIAVNAAITRTIVVLLYSSWYSVSSWLLLDGILAPARC